MFVPGRVPAVEKHWSRVQQAGVFVKTETSFLDHGALALAYIINIIYNIIFFGLKYFIGLSPATLPRL